MERRKRPGPDDAPLVVVLLHCCLNDARYTDAIAAHPERHSRTVGRCENCVHRGGVGLLELENVTQLDAPALLEPSCIAIATRESRSCLGKIVELGDRREVAAST